MIDFDQEYSSSIKSLAVKKDKKLTTRSIQSFAYDLIDVFMFPTGDVKKVYHKNKIRKSFLYQNLNDTDTLFFSYLLVIFHVIQMKKYREA